MIPSYGDKRSLKDYDRNNNLELDDAYVLHGLIHCNGFGHLISINKLDLGSAISLTETDVMNFWDSICTSLKTRYIFIISFNFCTNFHFLLVYLIQHLV